MIQANSFNQLAWIWIGLSVPVFIILQFVVAPFGRYSKEGFGPTINNTLAWVVMESVSFVAVAYLFMIGNASKTLASWIVVILWLGHYFNRSFIYPLRQKDTNKNMPVLIFLSAIVFNCINGGLNGYYLGYLSVYTQSLFLQWNFWIGIILFGTGMFINIKSDNMLLRLREPGEKGYKIPHGFLFKYISCPNHFGEIIEWTGFAILTWNWASASFATWTFANLAPRSIAHHKWYKKNFDTYPETQKALIPFIW